MISNPWKSTSVRTALEGRSFIDSKKIHIHTEKDANDFIESYGFRLDDLDDLRELQSIQTEAIDLIKSELLLPHEKIPKALVQQTNISQYLLIASGHGKKSEAPWAGSILRVMHTLIHSHSYLNDIYHDVIREQIFDRFEEKVKETNGETYFGPIKLEKLEFRKAKTRRSVAMKLLHKAENVAADIFDWIGIRFITQYRVDVIDLLAFLRNEHIITFANIKPSRSRNTLIDLDWFDQKLKEGMTIDNIRILLQNSEYPNPKNASIDNLFSEISYHSVQITCRQRIKVKQPDGKNLSFFFPYELQIMDRQSYISSREGLASHSEYKKRQRAAIRKRVLPFLS